MTDAACASSGLGGDVSVMDWKRHALERSFLAGQRFNKHLRMRNRHVTRQRIRAEVAMPAGDKAKNLAYEENVRLNSLINNLAQRSTEFGINMEEADDLSNDYMPDGLVEAVAEEEVLEQTLLSPGPEDDVMTPSALGSVTINGFAFRTFPTVESDHEIEAAAIPATWEAKTEQDEDIKPNVEEMNKILFPTKTTDITKIKGWRSKVFAEHDEFTVKQEVDEETEEKTKPATNQRNVNTPRLPVGRVNAFGSAKPSLLGCALTLPYTKTKPTPAPPNQKTQPNKPSSRLTNGEANAVPPPLPAAVPANPNRKPKTKAEYRRMLEDAARSRDMAAAAMPEPVPAAVAAPAPTNKEVKPQDVPVRKLYGVSKYKCRRLDDKRLKVNRVDNTAAQPATGSKELDSRFMYALVDGRPIKIVGSIRAKQIAEGRKAEAEKSAKSRKTKTPERRYVGLLASPPPPRPPLPAPPPPPPPPRARKTRPRPLSKQMEAKAKRLQQFCLKLHPAVGFPLTHAALHHLECLRNDQMDVDADWIKFATSVVSAKRAKVYVRKGFIDRDVTPAEVLLPVRVSESGRRYEPCDMEKFNTINVPAPEPSDTEDEKPETLQDVDCTDRTVADVRSLLRNMVDSVAKQATVEDLHLLAEPKPSKEPSGDGDFLNPSRGGAQPRKRRSALDKELRRLNVFVIEEPDAGDAAEEDADPVTAAAPACRQEHCKFGCVCHSLSRAGVASAHCGRTDCMFECVCGGSAPPPDEPNALPASVVSRINATSRLLARKEKEFQRTVVRNRNEVLVIDGSAAPATGRRKREVKLPLRFRESGIDDKALFGGNANLEVVEARRQCDAGGTAIAPPAAASPKAKRSPRATTNARTAVRGRVLFVPNHAKNALFYRRRAENMAAEQADAGRHGLRPCCVVMFRAGLELVTPYCIIHHEYDCPCMAAFTGSGEGGGGGGARRPRKPDSPPWRPRGWRRRDITPEPVADDGDDGESLDDDERLPPLPYMQRVSNWGSKRERRRNVAVKKTAPRHMPVFANLERCSRTEGVDRSYVVRNMAKTYKKTLRCRQRDFRAQLFGKHRSAVIPGSRILANEEDADGEEATDNEAVTGPAEDPSPLVCTEDFAAVQHGLLNPTQILPSNFDARRLLDPGADTMAVSKGESRVRTPTGETKMMRWSLLQDSFLNNSLQMWLSSPEVGMSKLYVSSNLKAPDLRCRNLRNWSGKTERGYPPLVTELMNQLPDEDLAELVRYAVMVRRKDHWEVIGIRKLPRQPAGQPGARTEHVKFLKGNAVMSVPLPVVRSPCRWHVIDIDGAFDRIVFQGCVIVAANILSLTNSAKRKNTVNAVLFKENFPTEFHTLGLPSMFGLYALPRIQECVFLGPFGLSGRNVDAIKMFKDVTDESLFPPTPGEGRVFVEVERPAGKTAWLYAEGLSDKEAADYRNKLCRKMLTDYQEKEKEAATAAAPPTKAEGFKQAVTSSRVVNAAGREVGAATGKPSGDLKQVLVYDSVGAARVVTVDTSQQAALLASSNATYKRKPFVANTSVQMAHRDTSGREAANTESLLQPSPVPAVDSKSPLPVSYVEEVITSSDVIDVPDSPIKATVVRSGRPIPSPPPLSLFRRRPSVDFLASSASPSPALLDSAASVSSGGAAAATTTAAVANRPGLTITGLTSVLKPCAVGEQQATELTDSDDEEIEFLPDDDEADSEVMVVSQSWQPTGRPVDLPADYEPAGTTTKDLVGEMFAASVEGSKRIKYIPSIPSLGYVEAYRLADNRTRIRFLDKPFIEATFANDAVGPYLDKGIRSNELLRVVPPDLPVTWEVSEDMDSHPEIPPFKYGQTFDGNHMLCEKGLLRKKAGNQAAVVPVVAVESTGQKARDEDVEALMRLKRILGIPNIDGVLLEEIFNQAGAEILHCKREEKLLKRRRDRCVRKRRKQTKKLRRLLLNMPDLAERRRFQVLINGIINNSRVANLAQGGSNVIDVPSDNEDQAEDPWLPNEDGVIDLAEPGFSLSAFTPRRLEAMIFPAVQSAKKASRPSKTFEEMLLQIQPASQRNSPARCKKPSQAANLTADTLLRTSLLLKPPPPPPPPVHRNRPTQDSLITLMDLTDDSAQPTVLLQKRPLLPVVTLDEDDGPPPEKRLQLVGGVTRMGERSPIVYSYGVNGAGHYFRCAIINNVIVNKVRITKLPNNVDCLRMVEQPSNLASRNVIQSIVVGGKGPGSVVRGTNRVSNLGRGQVDGQDASNVRPVVVPGTAQRSGRVIAITVPKGASQVAGSPPKKFGMIKVTVPKGITKSAVSPAKSSVKMPVSFPIGGGSIAETIRVAGKQNVKSVEKVFRQLISTGRLTDKTRQVLITGPMLPDNSNPSSESSKQLATLPQPGLLEITPTQEDTSSDNEATTSSRSSTKVLKEMHCIKINQNKRGKMQSTVINRTGGKFVQLKMQTTQSLLKIHVTLPEKRLSQLASRTGLVVQRKPATLPNGPIQSPAAGEEDDGSDNPATDKDDSADALVIDEGDIPDSGLDAELSEPAVEDIDGYPELMTTFHEEANALDVLNPNEATLPSDQMETAASSNDGDCHENLAVEAENDADALVIDEEDNPDSGLDAQLSESAVADNEGISELMSTVDEEANALNPNETTLPNGLMEPAASSEDGDSLEKLAVEADNDADELVIDDGDNPDLELDEELSGSAVADNDGNPVLMTTVDEEANALDLDVNNPEQSTPS